MLKSPRKHSWLCSNSTARYWILDAGYRIILMTSKMALNGIFLYFRVTLTLQFRLIDLTKIKAENEKNEINSDIRLVSSDNLYFTD